ncbi:MAG: O-antigen ligase family protein [Gemmatimonadota bacterium]|nr:O-antigen ligase family protein [Gemmatimonadota bacterium]MDQ8147958.1 O-antigen ligase family protein [Gemmatimonadota bacterium]MDQ8149637.1 O-antigen ligase family protein [Gemmatimonadota bacterium]MDQ8177301.1 O-antigen ligase family protein [Gemmatimonadota bacterium]
MSASVHAARRHTLLAIWVALLGADRLDLLGGRGPVVLTPFLLLTPIVAIRELMARRRRLAADWLQLPPRALAHGTLLLLLIALAAASVLASLDPMTTGQRTALLAAQAIGASGILWALHGDPEGRTGLARGARLGLLLACLADLAQGAAFVSWLPSAVAIGDWQFIDLQAFNYAGVVPRLSGLALDPNRGALLALIHLAMLGADDRPRPRGWTALGVLLLVVTLSRSGVLAAGVAVVVWSSTTSASHRWVARRHANPSRALDEGRSGRTTARLSPRLTLALAAAVAVVALGLLAAPDARAAVADRLAPAAERLSAAEGSARLHGELIGRGMAEATRDVPRTLLGSGYGTSFLLLRDVFGTRYGNFHSLYVSTWVETGIIALLVVLALLLLPLRWAGRWRPAIAALVVFNLFYQAGTEPGLWAMITLAWQEGAA